MTDYKEEQQMEMEALESILEDDFEKLSDTKLRVKILPNDEDTDNFGEKTDFNALPTFLCPPPRDLS